MPRSAQDVDHPPVLEPDLVVEEPAAAARTELADRCLGALGRVQPVVVDMPQPRIALGHGLAQLVQRLVQQPGQFLLPGWLKQEVVEGLEGAPLVGPGDGLSAAEHVIEELALAALPPGDLLPQLPVQSRSSPRPGGSPTAAPMRSRRAAGTGRGRHWRPAGGHLPASARSRLRSPAAAGRALRSAPGVGLGAVHDLPQQLENGVQPRLGADELALAQRTHPRQCLLHGGGGVEVRLVSAVRVVLAQPAGFGAGPVVEVGLRQLGEALGVPWFSAYSSSSRRLASSQREWSGHCPRRTPDAGS